MERLLAYKGPVVHVDHSHRRPLRSPVRTGWGGGDGPFVTDQLDARFVPLAMHEGAEGKLYNDSSSVPRSIQNYNDPFSNGYVAITLHVNIGADVTVPLHGAVLVFLMPKTHLGSHIGFQLVHTKDQARTQHDLIMVMNKVYNPAWMAEVVQKIVAGELAAGASPEFRAALQAGTPAVILNPELPRPWER